MNSEASFFQREGMTCPRTHSTGRTRTQVSIHCTTLWDIIHLDSNVKGNPRGCDPVFHQSTLLGQ